VVAAPHARSRRCRCERLTRLRSRWTATGVVTTRAPVGRLNGFGPMGPVGYACEAAPIGPASAFSFPGWLKRRPTSTSTASTDEAVYTSSHTDVEEWPIGRP